ncbi:hypothetical protein LTR66_001126 [Elasticomyces elasticus]|nr:hypothetical protein LTR66_001126 [Elasticomyces elasticus]
MVTCNTTLTDERIVEVPLWKGIEFHRFGLVLSAVFALISASVACYLIFQHATRYLRPWEQKHIIRILLMIPIYSTVSFLSYLYYRHAIYFEVLRDCYEAFAIASFFTLLCHYIAPNLHDQKDYFRGLKPVNWFWGVFGLQKCTGGQDKGLLRKPRSGLTWFNVIWIGVFQYCFVRVFFTTVSVVTQVGGRYCESSLNPAFAHIWVMVFEGSSVSVAMFCLIQFYIQLRTDLAEHRPFLKVLCIKLVIFFSFWQTLVISFLTSSSGPLKPSPKIAYPDLKVGIPSMLLCVEMAIFSILHLFAFPWRQYDISRHYADPLAAHGSGYSGETPKYRGGWLGIKALLDAFNPWDIIKASARGFRWLFVGRKHRHHDASYGASKLNSASAAAGYVGPSFAGTGDAATELGPDKDSVDARPGRGRRGRHDGMDEDSAGLLAHAQSTPANQSPSRSEESSAGHGRTHSNLAMHNPSTVDLGTMDPTRYPLPEPSGNTFGHGVPRPTHVYEDTEYHGLAPTAAWNMLAGAREGDSGSVRPPTYRTTEDR